MSFLKYVSFYDILRHDQGWENLSYYELNLFHKNQKESVKCIRFKANFHVITTQS